MRNVIRSVCFLDSIHCGSRYAIWPKDFLLKEFEGDEGHIVNLSPQQELLLQHFDDFWNECGHFDVDTVIITGESVDGNNPAEIGLGLLTTDVGQQVDAAVALVKPCLKDRKLYVLEGSAYHVQGKNFSVNADKYFCDKIGGEWKGPLLNIRFHPSDLIWNISHDYSASYMYPATAMQKEQNFINEMIACQKYPTNRVDWVVRGHGHEYFALLWEHTSGFMVPGWKMYHVIKHRTRYHAKHMPTIGGVIALIYDNGDVQLIPRTYETPHVYGQLQEA